MVNGVVVPLLDQSAYVPECLQYVDSLVKWDSIRYVVPLFSISVLMLSSLF